MGNTDEINARQNSPSLIKNILSAGLIAGTLDISAAILVYTIILAKAGAVQILQSIASGVFGKTAFAGGAETAVYGFIFHYIIAFSWTIIYFLIFPYISFLRNYKIIGGLIYGGIVWLIMNLIVLPLSNVSQNPFKWDGVLIGVVTLMLCIGLPVSLLAHRFYRSKSNS